MRRSGRESKQDTTGKKILCKRFSFHSQVTISLTDIPSNIKIECHGRGAGLEPHESDVILMVKRNAADQSLAQDMEGTWKLETFGNQMFQSNRLEDVNNT